MYRLPGGCKTTTSEAVYRREWRKVIKPLEKLTGWTVTAYDPGLSLSKMRLLPNGKTAYDYSIQIPVEFAREIVKCHQMAVLAFEMLSVLNKLARKSRSARLDACLWYTHFKKKINFLSKLAVMVAVSSGLSGCATCEFKPKLVEPTPDRPAQVQLWTW
jgi:hypothetical protein